jgi:hypothetical protein
MSMKKKSSIVLATVSGIIFSQAAWAAADELVRVGGKIVEGVVNAGKVGDDAAKVGSKASKAKPIPHGTPTGAQVDALEAAEAARAKAIAEKQKLSSKPQAVPAPQASKPAPKAAPKPTTQAAKPAPKPTTQATQKPAPKEAAPVVRTTVHPEVENLIGSPDKDGTFLVAALKNQKEDSLSTLNLLATKADDAGVKVKYVKQLPADPSDPLSGLAKVSDDGMTIEVTPQGMKRLEKNLAANRGKFLDDVKKLRECPKACVGKLCGGAGVPSVPTPSSH